MGMGWGGERDLKKIKKLSGEVRVIFTVFIESSGSLGPSIRSIALLKS